MRPRPSRAVATATTKAVHLETKSFSCRGGEGTCISPAAVAAAWRDGTEAEVRSKGPTTTMTATIMDPIERQASETSLASVGSSTRASSCSPQSSPTSPDPVVSPTSEDRRWVGRTLSVDRNGAPMPPSPRSPLRRRSLLFRAKPTPLSESAPPTVAFGMDVPPFPPTPRRPRRPCYGRSRSLGELLTSRTSTKTNDGNSSRSLRFLQGSEGCWPKARSYRMLISSDGGNDQDEPRGSAASSRTPSSSTSHLSTTGEMLLVPLASATSLASSPRANVYCITPPGSRPTTNTRTVVEVAVLVPCGSDPNRRGLSRVSTDRGALSNIRADNLRGAAPADTAFRWGSRESRAKREWDAPPPPQRKTYDPTRLPQYESLRRSPSCGDRRTCPKTYRGRRHQGTGIQDVLDDCAAAERLRNELQETTMTLDDDDDDDEHLAMNPEGSDLNLLFRRLGWIIDWSPRLE